MRAVGTAGVEKVKARDIGHAFVVDQGAACIQAAATQAPVAAVVARSEGRQDAVRVELLLDEQGGEVLHGQREGQGGGGVLPCQAGSWGKAGWGAPRVIAARGGAGKG